MKPILKVGLSLIGVAVIAAIGFGLGFRQAWRLAPMVAAAPQGAVALWQVQLLDVGRTEEVKFKLESDVDSGLIWWYETSRSPLRPLLNQLSGTDVVPNYEKYIRQLAAYRKTHPSPVLDPALTAQVQSNLAKVDPDFGAMAAEGARDAQRAIDAMVTEYGQ